MKGDWRKDNDKKKFKSNVGTQFKDKLPGPNEVQESIQFAIDKNIVGPRGFLIKLIYQQNNNEFLN